MKIYHIPRSFHCPADNSGIIPRNRLLSRSKYLSGEEFPLLKGRDPPNRFCDRKSPRRDGILNRLTGKVPLISLPERSKV